MNKFLCFVILGCFIISCNTEIKEPDNQVIAAMGVIQRSVPEMKGRVTLSIITAENGKDVYELAAQNGQLTVNGNNTISLCRGFYDYLRNDLHCLVSWDGDQLEIPKILPDVKPRRITSPVKFRHYLNLCTAGYTTAFWDWKRWEREIDWMALHGINMPLAMNGQEKIWLNVWQKMGLTKQQTRAFFSGPAFLPWLRMGCLQEWGGPLPRKYIEKDAELQKKILSRQQELGMTPILPAFSGFVPNELKDLYPDANISKSSGWCGFRPTNLLEPRDSLFNKISVLFGKEYEKEFGKRSGYYIADLYTEMKPQVEEKTAAEELRQITTNVYNALVASDSNAVWIMQGWMFHFEWERFWNEKTVNAFLEGIPDKRLIVLDLGAEREEIWRKYNAIGNRQYIWNHLHNFGQHTNLFGMLDIIATNPAKALKDSEQGNMVGMGITMEGTEQNYIEYELMLDMMWRDTPIELNSWISNYASFRYNSQDPRIANLWKLIYQKYYRLKGKTEDAWKFASYEKRPSKKSLIELSEIQPDPEKREIIELMLLLPDKVQKSALFQRDLVDVSKDYLQEVLGTKMYDLIKSVENGNLQKANELQNNINDYIDIIDALLATVPGHRMDNWIKMAKQKVDSEEDKILLEKNARMLVTVWGGTLNDYAHKEWSGLAGDYYKGRWNLFFNEYNKSGFDWDKFEILITTWEYNWCEKTNLPEPKIINPIEQIQKMILKEKFEE